MVQMHVILLFETVSFCTVLFCFVFVFDSLVIISGVEPADDPAGKER